jgi:hypothetical protein
MSVLIFTSLKPSLSPEAALVEMWNDARIANPDQTQIMLAYTRVDVQALNDEARRFTPCSKVNLEWS